jgi:DNA-binding NarL/FixJ family response regulator
MSAVGVLTVHHEEQARRDLRTVVAQTPGFEAVGEAASAEEALELALALRPDLVVVGAHMPGIDGFETSRRLLAAVPEARVALLYGTTQVNGNSVADSGAIGALPLERLTPAALQALWEEREAG